MKTFTELVVERLPEGHQFLRIFATSQDHSTVETRGDGQWYTNIIEKLDLSTAIEGIIHVEVPENGTHDDIYQAYSDQLGLGLVKGVDYFDTSGISVSDHPTYFSLPLLHDSYGYKGEIRCMVSTLRSSLNGVIEQRDLTESDQSNFYYGVKVRTFLCSKVFFIAPKEPVFVGGGFSSLFIDEIMNDAHREFDYVQAIDLNENLVRGTIVGLINDGLSDIVVFRFINGSDAFVRFLSSTGDLPVIENK